MSKTVTEIRNRVIENLGDFDRSKPAYTTPQYDLAIKGGYQALAARMPWPHVYTLSGLTLGPNTDVFVMPTNLGADVRIRLQSTGQFLRNVMVEVIDAMRVGQPTPPGPYNSIPHSVAFWREPGSVGTDLHGRCYPGARNAEVCDIFTDKIPDELVGPALNAQNVLFDTTAAEALILKVSSSMVKRAPADEIAKLKINPTITQEWDADMERMLYRAVDTWYGIQGAGYTHRFVP